MQIRALKPFVAALVTTLAGCGGGGGGGNTVSPVVDPKITVYSTFNLANSILTGISASDGVLQACGSASPTVAKQIELMKYTYVAAIQQYTRYNLVLDGAFNLPNVASCSTTGITGTINGVTFLMNGNTVYSLQSLFIDAGSFRYGYQTFWANVLKQSGRLISTSASAYQINCTDSAGKAWYTPLAANSDISNFFVTCAK